MSSITGSVGYISHVNSLSLRLPGFLSGFSGFIWLDTKIVLKNKQKTCQLSYVDDFGNLIPIS